MSIVSSVIAAAIMILTIVGTTIASFNIIDNAGEAIGIMTVAYAILYFFLAACMTVSWATIGWSSAWGAVVSGFFTVIWLVAIIHPVISILKAKSYARNHPLIIRFGSGPGSPLLSINHSSQQQKKKAAIDNIKHGRSHTEHVNDNKF